MESNTKTFYIKFQGLKHFLCARTFFKANGINFGPVDCMTGSVWFNAEPSAPAELLRWMWEKQQAVVMVFDSSGEEVVTENTYRV